MPSRLTKPDTRNAVSSWGLSLLNGVFHTGLPSITPGHEASGTIDELGSPVPGR
ncbi:hypothetical protein [Streptomyces sp. NPDC059994]|uniref:hypothetical protein n=1 Tax=Streptomyces sp. NPDC059994 TaxID=3347029 RepID=UPI0036994EA9